MILAATQAGSVPSPRPGLLLAFSRSAYGATLRVCGQRGRRPSMRSPGYRADWRGANHPRQGQITRDGGEKNRWALRTRGCLRKLPGGSDRPTAATTGRGDRPMPPGKAGGADPKRTRQNPNRTSRSSGRRRTSAAGRIAPAPACNLLQSMVPATGAAGSSRDGQGPGPASPATDPALHDGEADGERD